MPKKLLIISLCLASSLISGCSSKPDVSDISAPLEEFWGKCAKMTDLTKTNGVDKGDSYLMSFSYKLEVLEDGRSGNSLFAGIPPSCALAQGIALTNIMAANGKQEIKKGDVYTVTDEQNMVKSEKGWIGQ